MQEEEEKKFSTNTKLLDDDWGSLNFTPTFMGEYKFTTKELEKEKETIVLSTQHEEESTQASASKIPTKEEDKNYTTNYDELDHEQPPSSK